MDSRLVRHTHVVVDCAQATAAILPARAAPAVERRALDELGQCSIAR
jgi:hypothetical protein